MIGEAEDRADGPTTGPIAGSNPALGTKKSDTLQVLVEISFVVLQLRDRNLLGLSIFHAVNDGSLAVFLASLPVMRVALDLSLIQIGSILSAGLLVTVVMQMIFGYVSDMGHAHTLLVAGLASLVVTDLAFVAAGNYVHVLLFYILLRAAVGVYHPVSFSTIVQTAKNRHSAMGFQSAFGDGSLAFAMFSTGFVAESFGWQFPFLAWGLAAFFAFFVFVLLVGYRGKFANAEVPTGELAAGERAGGATRHYVILQFSSVFLQCLYATFTGFVPLFVNIQLKLSPGLSSLIVALWLAIGVTSSFNAGSFVRFFRDEERTLKICFGSVTFLMVSAAVLLLRPEYWYAGLMLLVLSGIPYFVTFPVMYGMVGTKAPPKRLGLAYATNLSLSLIAGSAVSYGAAYFASIFGLLVIFPILIAAAAGASVTALLL